MKVTVGYGKRHRNKKAYRGFIMKGENFVCLVVLLILIGLTLNAQEAKAKGDSSPVALRGKIEAFLWTELHYPRWEYYVFSDETGSITLIIDKNLWKGLSVNKNDLVEVTGGDGDGSIV